MRTPTQFGFGWLVVWACMSFFFAATAGPPQPYSNATPTDPVRIEALPEVPPNPAGEPTTPEALSPVVLPVVELIRQERDAALSQHTATITAQLDLLKETFATRQDQHLRALQRSNRLTLAMAGILLGAVLLGTLCFGLISLRAMNRLVAKISTSPLVQVLLHSPAPAWPAQEDQLRAMYPEESAGERLHGAIARLEQRLVALERTLSPPQLPSPPLTAGQLAAKVTVQHSPPAPAAAKPGVGPHVALAFGTGEALCFLPKEASQPPMPAVHPLLAKLKRPLQALRIGKGH